MNKFDLFDDEDTIIDHVQPMTRKVSKMRQSNEYQLKDSQKKHRREVRKNAFNNKRAD